MLPRPEIDQEQVVWVGYVRSAETGVEEVEVQVGRDVAESKLLGHLIGGAFKMHVISYTLKTFTPNANLFLHIQSKDKCDMF